MPLGKILKWTRRALISAVCDPMWKTGKSSPEWIGSASGGAYVYLSHISENAIIYSFGIATEISFDRAIISRCNCKVFGFDPDPRSENWLNQPDIWVPQQFHFSRIALDSRSGTRSFFLTDIERMTGGFSRGPRTQEIEVECLTLADIMKRFSHDWVDYIKMDVEAAEYDILSSWLDKYEQLPVGQMWVEFHPNGQDYTESMSKHLVTQMGRIGMVPSYRNYFRQPNNYLMINKSLANQSVDGTR